MSLELASDRRPCLKCGHVRQPGDAGPDFACPRCGAVYAKLEALQRAQEEAAEVAALATLHFERRSASHERFDREQAARDAADRPARLAAHAVYLMMVLPFAATQAIAVATAYKFHRASEDHWLNDHFSWQIRTFWYLALLSVAAILSLLVGAAATTTFVVLRSEGPAALGIKAMGGAVLFGGLALLVAIYRIGKGWYRLTQGEAP
jgi:uncharacterized membrane protein/predicted RNA-binding Zn-ribbon protein involved in translation (DUF1610 family)